MIPNHEIKMIYEETFNDWIKEIKENYSQKLIDALLDHDEDKANEILKLYIITSNELSR